MMAETDLLDRAGLDTGRVQGIVDAALHGMDDGELFVEHRTSESFSFDDGRLKSASFDTSQGFGLRAVAVDPSSAGLVGINVPRASALAFALGGAVTAAGGASISAFLTTDASIGIIFTLKALVIVIMGGVAHIRGTIVAALILGLTETAVATLIDPGLTLAAAYLLFILVLLIRPEGLFGRRAS